MARAKIKIVKRTPNLGAQAITETPVGHETTLVIRLKNGKYSSTDKPLDERILYNVD